MKERFNVRVYGLLLNENEEVLLSDEFEFDRAFTKFPGGGLKHGEGTIDGLKREFEEELNLSIEVVSHFYTTDFYQASAFRKTDQLVSIYYKVAALADLRVPVTTTAFDFEERINGAQVFRWMPLSQLAANDLTFPIDQHVATLLGQD